MTGNPIKLRISTHGFRPGKGSSKEGSCLFESRILYPFPVSLGWWRSLLVAFDCLLDCVLVGSSSFGHDMVVDVMESIIAVVGIARCCFSL